MKTIGSLLCLGVLSLAAVPGSTARAEDKKPAEKAADKPAEAMATVGGVPITTVEFDAAMRKRLDYDAKRQVLDDLIAQSLLEKEAKARGITVDALLKAEVDAKAEPATDEQAKAYFDQNNIKARFPGRDEADLLAQIKAGQQREHVQQRRGEFMRELRAKTPVKVLLDPPRVVVEPTDAPARGPVGAPITIVEFSDFQCPYCGRVEPTLKQVQDLYGDRIRLVYRDYPLPMHAQAPKASEAAACAQDQGKFWEMHDKLFANQAALQIADLKQRAVDIGLKADEFNQCLDSGKHEADVKKNMEAGSRYGVSGTPAFFINGRSVSGARPLDDFTRIIDDELERAGLPLPAAPKPKPAPAAAAAEAPKPPAPKQ